MSGYMDEEDKNAEAKTMLYTFYLIMLTIGAGGIAGLLVLISLIL